MIGHTDRNLTASPAISGNNPKDEMQNIYDLEGNYWEWTAEADYTGYRVYRGGNFYGVSYDYFNPASGRDGDFLSVTSSEFSSRSALYVAL